MADRDERNTRLAQNAVQRRDLEMQDRLRPALEGERSSQLELGTARNQSDLRNNPFHEKEDAAESQYRTARAAADLETLPGDVAAKTEVRDLQLGQMRRQDPRAEQLARITKDPAHLAAYDYFKTTAPKEIRDPEERSHYAYNQSLRLAQDQEDVDAVIEARAKGELSDESMAAMLESVDSPDGQHFGLRVRPEARVRTRTMKAERGMRKQNLQEQRELRIAQASHDAQILRTLDDQVSDYRKALETSNDSTAKAKLEKAQRDREMILERMMGSAAQGGKTSASQDGKPVDQSRLNALIRQ